MNMHLISIFVVTLGTFLLSSSPIQAQAPVKCDGGDNCCGSGNYKCLEGEGDCDHDSQCASGLFCGRNNCQGPNFDATDDCCVKEYGGDCTSGTSPTTPSNPTAVSCYLGDRTAGASPGYPILFPLSTTGNLAIQTTTGADDGIAYPISSTTAFCSTAPCTAANTALSIVDFNYFRSNVKASLDILDQKIRDLDMALKTTKT
jgi:hypothetical protein